MTIKVSLNNSAGELDCRIVNSEEETRAAALDLLSGCAFLSHGDTITVTEKDDSVEATMTSAGYEAISTGGGCEAWEKRLGDKTAIWICTADQGIDGNPDAAEWLLGRQGSDGGFVEVDDALTLADALALAPRLASPILADGAEVQISVSATKVRGEG